MIKEKSVFGTVSLLRCAVQHVVMRRFGLPVCSVITLLKTRLLIVCMSATWECAKQLSDNWGLPTILAWCSRPRFSCLVCCGVGRLVPGNELHSTAASLWGSTPTPAGEISGRSCSLMGWCSETALESSTKNKESDVCPSGNLLCLGNSKVLLTWWHQKIWYSRN